MVRSLRFVAFMGVFFITSLCLVDAQEPKKDPPTDKKEGKEGKEGPNKKDITSKKDMPMGKSPMGKGPPKPGFVLPPGLKDMLKLTDAQKAEVEALQKEADAELAKILSPEQLQQLQQIKERGPLGMFFPGGGKDGKDGKGMDPTKKEGKKDDKKEEKKEEKKDS